MNALQFVKRLATEKSQMPSGKLPTEERELLRRKLTEWGEEVGG